MSREETIQAFRFGKGSNGEAVRQGKQFLHKGSRLRPSEFAEKSGAAKAPYGSHRLNLSVEAARLFPTYRGRATGFDPQTL